MIKDAPNMPRKEKKKPFVVPPYLELHLQMNQYGGENIKNSGASPANKSNDGLAGGIPRKYCSDGHANVSKRRAACGVSG